MCIDYAEREALNQKDVDSHLEPSTINKYSSGARRFIRFCEDSDIQPIPNIENLSHFISIISREIQPSSVKAYLSGIVHFFKHSYPAVVEARSSDRVRRTMRGSEKLRSTPTKRAEAFTLIDIDLASKAFNTSFDDLLFNTIIAIGFAALHRLGELVTPDQIQLRNPRKLIKRHSVVFSLCGTGVSYTLPYHKGDPLFKGSPVVVISRPGKTCPVKSLLRYINLRDKRFPSQEALFVRYNGLLPTRSWFFYRLKAAFGSSRSGHSLRAGGATALAQAGMDSDRIQLIGRWSSEAFRIYIRNHPILNMRQARDHMPDIGRTLGEQLIFPSTAPCMFEYNEAVHSRDAVVQTTSGPASRADVTHRVATFPLAGPSHDGESEQLIAPNGAEAGPFTAPFTYSAFHAIDPAFL